MKKEKFETLQPKVLKLRKKYEAGITARIDTVMKQYAARRRELLQSAGWTVPEYCHLDRSEYKFFPFPFIGLTPKEFGFK
jgi:hypothetical protein